MGVMQDEMACCRHRLYDICLCCEAKHHNACHGVRHTPNAPAAELDETAGGGRPLPQLDETVDGESPWRHPIWMGPSSWLSAWPVCGKLLLDMGQPFLHPGHCTIWICEHISAIVSITPECQLPGGVQEWIW